MARTLTRSTARLRPDQDDYLKGLATARRLRETAALREVLETWRRGGGPQTPPTEQAFAPRPRQPQWTCPWPLNLTHELRVALEAYQARFDIADIAAVVREAVDFVHQHCDPTSHHPPMPLAARHASSRRERATQPALADLVG